MNPSKHEISGAVEEVSVTACRIPTDRPESDGTLRWDSTTIVVVEVRADEETGLGWTYCHAAAAELIREKLAGVVRGRDPADIPGSFEAMRNAVRNFGRPGIAAMAISAVDVALWDLKARLLDVSLSALLGRYCDEVPIYGSGGFTSYSDRELAEQLAGWVEAGIPRVKMKVGRNPDADPHRVAVAREAIGDGPALFVDANGAYDPKQAIAMGERFADRGVTWYEEPVSSDDLAGLALVRERVPAPMEVAAGEYGFDDTYFLRMLGAGAVDVIQADVTRCFGITGFAAAAAVARAARAPISGHCVPQIHAHLGCTFPHFRNLEYFHDHVRIERMLFDGVLEPEEGALAPDPSRPGMGLAFRREDAEEWRV